MKKNYSKWLDEYVYHMSEQQEQYLISEGFHIHNPSKCEHEDGIIRDIPNSIMVNNEENVNIKFVRSTGKFLIRIFQTSIKSGVEVNEMTQRIFYLNDVIAKLNSLDS